MFLFQNSSKVCKAAKNRRRKENFLKPAEVPIQIQTLHKDKKIPQNTWRDRTINIWLVLTIYVRLPIILACIGWIHRRILGKQGLWSRFSVTGEEKIYFLPGTIFAVPVWIVLFSVFKQRPPYPSSILYKSISMSFNPFLNTKVIFTSFFAHVVRLEAT